MFDIALTAIAWIAIAMLSLACVGVLMVPFYFWARWRTDEELAEARQAGLID